MSKGKNEISRYYSEKRINEIMENIKNNKDKFIEKLGKNWQKFKLRCVLLGGVAALTLSGCSFAEKNYSETPHEIHEVMQDVETPKTEETGLNCVLEKTVVDENDPNESHIEREQITAESIQQAIKQAEEMGFNTIGIRLPKDYTLTKSVKIPDGFKLYLYGDSDSLSTVNLSINNGTTIPTFELGKDSEIFASHLEFTRNDSTYRGTFIESTSDASGVSLNWVSSQCSLRINGSFDKISIEDCDMLGLQIDSENRINSAIIKRTKMKSLIIPESNIISIQDGKVKKVDCKDGSYFTVTQSEIEILELDSFKNVLCEGDSFNFGKLKDTNGNFNKCTFKDMLIASSSSPDMQINLDSCLVDYVDLLDQTVSLNNCMGFTDNKVATVIRKEDKTQQTGSNNSTKTRSTTKQESANEQDEKERTNDQGEKKSADKQDDEKRTNNQVER